MKLFRVQARDGSMHYYREQDLIRAYRFAKKNSVYSDLPIVLESVETHQAKNLVEVVENVLCDNEPMFHHITHLRYFENGEVLSRRD